MTSFIIVASTFLVTAALGADTFVAIVIAALSGSGLGALAAYRKSGAERESISVATLRGVVETLNEELDRKDARIRELEQRVAVLEARVDRVDHDTPPGGNR